MFSSNNFIENFIYDKKEKKEKKEKKGVSRKRI